jgi:hypothetical protein
LRYPARGGGYMRLCDEHGEKHRRYCGTWDGERWHAGAWEQPEAADAVARIDGIVTGSDRANENLRLLSSSLKGSI